MSYIKNCQLTDISMRHGCYILASSQVMVLTFLSCSIFHQASGSVTDLTPFDYGLAEAKTGMDRYDVLLRTHQAAVASGVNVDYSGIKRIEIEIPRHYTPIPLSDYNDFKGCVFVVTNTYKNCHLFEYVGNGRPISVNKKQIDDGDFRSIPVLKKGKNLLIVEDKNPWVDKRKGYDYGHQRKDVLLIENGVATNSVTRSYNNIDSNPECLYIKQNEKPFIFKNITIERTTGCTFLTHILYVKGIDNVIISDVAIHTPANKLANDRGLLIYDCTNVKMENVHIDGTYSQTDRSGYGVTLNNVWNFKATWMYGKGNWGIFGNNNVNTALIEDSKINRFDIHCYGRDISFKNVEFFDLYNQYSSVFGTISYDHCTFTNFVPVLNGGSYNSYVEHDIVFNDCVFNATKKKNYLIKLSKLGTDVNARRELATKALPNVRIKNLTVNMTDGADYLYLFFPNTSARKVEGLNYLSDITIDGMTIVEDVKESFKGIALSNVHLNTAKQVKCTVQNVEVRPTGKAVKSSSLGRANDAVLKANMPLKGDKALMRNVRGLKQ